VDCAVTVARVDVKRAADMYARVKPPPDRCRVGRSLDRRGPSTSACRRHHASRRPSGSSGLHPADPGAPWPRR